MTSKRTSATADSRIQFGYTACRIGLAHCCLSLLNPLVFSAVKSQCLCSDVARMGAKVHVNQILFLNLYWRTAPDPLADWASPDQRILITFRDLPDIRFRSYVWPLFTIAFQFWLGVQVEAVLSPNYRVLTQTMQSTELNCQCVLCRGGLGVFWGLCHQQQFRAPLGVEIQNGRYVSEFCHINKL